MLFHPLKIVRHYYPFVLLLVDGAHSEQSVAMRYLGAPVLPHNLRVSFLFRSKPHRSDQSGTASHITAMAFSDRRLYYLDIISKVNAGCP